MKDRITSNIIPVLIILAISTLYMYILTPHGSATSPDSLSYLDISSNFKNGNGTVETDFSLGHYPNKVFKKQKPWPPLYPILMSINSLPRPSVETVSHLSIGLLSLTILFVYLTLTAFFSRLVALTSALALCMSVPMISTYTYVWSETLFIPLLSIASWSSIQYLKNDNQDNSRKYIYWGGLLISIIGLALTRYIGIIYFLLLPVTFIVSRRKKETLLLLVVAIVVYGLCIGYLLYGNFAVSGSISGMDRLPSDKTFLENIGDLYGAVNIMLPNSKVTLVIISSISLLFSFFYKKTFINVKARTFEISNSIVILGFVFLLYITALVTLRTVSYFDALDVRLLMPIFPTLWTLLFILLSKLSNKENFNLLICSLVIFLIIAFPVAGYTQLLKTMDNWKKLGDPKILANGEKTYKNYTFNHKYRLIQQSIVPLIVSRKSVLISTKPMAFTLETDIPSFQLPPEINLETITAINKLPEKSIMLLTNEKHYFQFSALTTENTLVFKIFDLDGALAIETPIKILGSK